MPSYSSTKSLLTCSCPFGAANVLTPRITNEQLTAPTPAPPTFHVPQDPFSPLISWGSFSLELPKVSSLSGGSSPIESSPAFREDSFGAQPPPAPPPSGSGSSHSLPLWLWVVIAISIVLTATGCVVLAGAIRRRHVLRKYDVAKYGRRHAQMRGRTVVTAPVENDPAAGVMGLVGESGSGSAGAAAVGASDEAASEARLLRRSVTAGAALANPEAAAQVLQLRRSATGGSVLRLEDVDLTLAGEADAVRTGGSRAAGSGPTSPVGPCATSPANLERRGWGMGAHFKAAPGAGPGASTGGVDEISPASSLHTTMLATDMHLAAQQGEELHEHEQEQQGAEGGAPTGTGAGAAAKAGASPHELQLPGSTEDVKGVRTLPPGAGVTAAAAIIAAGGGAASGPSFHSPPPPPQQQLPNRAPSSAMRVSMRNRRASLPTSLASAVQDADGTERQLSDPAGLTAVGSGKSYRWPGLAAHFSADGRDVGLGADGAALAAGRGSSTRWPSLAARVSTNGKAASPSADSAALADGRGGGGPVIQAAPVRQPPRRVLTSIGSSVLREQKSSARRASTLGFSMDGREKLSVAAGRASVPGLGGGGAASATTSAAAAAAASASQPGVADSPFRSSASVAWDDPPLVPVPDAAPGGGGGAGIGQFVRMSTGDLQYQQPPAAAPRPRGRTLAALMREQQQPQAGGSPSRRHPMSRPTSMLSVSTSAPFTPMPRSPGSSNSPRANTSSSTDGTRTAQPQYGKAGLASPSDAPPSPYTAGDARALNLLDVLGTPAVARAPVIPGAASRVAGETPPRLQLSPGSTPAHNARNWEHTAGTTEDVPRPFYRAGPLSVGGSSRRQPPSRLLLPPDSSRTYPLSPAAASAPLPSPAAARTPSRTANGYTPTASYPSSPRAGAIILSPEAADAAQGALGSAAAATANTRFRRSSSSALPVVMHENPLARGTGRPSSLAVKPVVVESGSQQGQQQSPPQPLQAPEPGDGGSARGQLSERVMRLEGLTEAVGRLRGARSLFTGVIRRSMAGTGAGAGAVKN